MPAIGIGTPIFLVVQALVSSFVYLEAKRSGLRAPFVTGGCVFVLGVVLAVVFSTPLGVVAAELLLVFIYYLGVRAAGRRSISP